MAVCLLSWTPEEVRSVIRFLDARGLGPSEIHRQLVEVYGENVMSKKQVYFWCNQFSAGRTSIADEPRSGRPSTSKTDENVQHIDDLIRQDRRVKITFIADTVGLSVGEVHNIVHEVLGYSKVCARWVPKQLTDTHKETRMGSSLTHLQRYNMEGENFLYRIVTGDETWVHYLTPETKRDSMTWKHVNSPPPKKFKIVPSAKKLMATVFWDHKGPLLIEYMEKGKTVNSEQYCNTLDKLRMAIRKRRPRLLSDGVILLHDNATPHTAAHTREWLDRHNWEILEHPPHSPDLAPSDFHLFGPLKRHLSGQCFKTDEDIKEAVKDWFSTRVPEFYAQGIDALVHRWDKCLNKYGDYVEK